MKKVLKVLALVLSITLIVGAFAACSQEKKVSTGGKYTYWAVLDGNVSQTLTNYSELLMYQEMCKRTGTNVDFIHPASGTTGSEAFQILLASGDFPDMIEYSWKSYAGGPDQAIADGVIIALNDYMEDYAPNYYNYMEGKGGKDRNYKAGSVSLGGNYYGFKQLKVGDTGTYSGLYVRADLLKKWGLDVPETIADWENLFEIAKQNGVKYPFTGSQSRFVSMEQLYTHDYFNTAWEVSGTYYIDGDTVKFGPFEPEYKEYLKKMAEWMAKGYIDPDFVTNDATIIQGQITNGTSIASVGGIGGDIGAIIPAMAERDPEFDLVACPTPVMNKGDIPMFQAVEQDASDPNIAISTQCGEDDENRYKEAISFCDYLYSDEGMILKSFGVEGETFTVEKNEDGEEHYVYTDKVLNYDEFGATNMSAALYHFMLPANHPGFSQHPDYLNGYYEHPRQKEALQVWNKYVNEAKKHVFPGSSLSYTEEEAAEIANVEFVALDNLIAAFCDIILGKASIDTYDKAVQDAKKAGYDKLIKIHQTAYDRYIGVVNK